jgi:hypothetical protein
MKRLWILVAMMLAGPALLPGLLFRDDAPFTFQSLESLTEKGQPVFNRVSWIPGWSQDIWLMQQSQEGIRLPLQRWDRLAIVVDKSRSPYQAKFYQLRSGAGGLLARNPDFSEVVPYKARCFACHVSGPRAIRPRSDSAQAPMRWSDSLKISLWNLRIKTYGAMESLPGQTETQEGAPFRSRHRLLKQAMALDSCVSCHKPGGIRSPLSLEHVGTASFLVQKGLMPPFPFGVSPEDASLLKRMVSAE